MKRDYQCSNREDFPITGSPGTGKMWPDDGPVDENFAALGYRVRPSEMEDVAQKIAQLEAMEAAQQGGLCHIASGTVHYNPSDISSWLESMLSGFNSEPGFDASPDPLLDSSTITTAPADNGASVSSRSVELDDFGSDLIAIPGKAVFQPPPPPPQAKKLKTSPLTETPVTNLQVEPGIADPCRAVVFVDSQENGIRLVHTLMACAEAVQQENFKLAETLVKNIGFLAVSQAGAMRKVAMYFAEALARKIYRLCPTNAQDTAVADLLQNYFYETCPYLKFAHFTANQAILEAFAGKKKVHVIDFSMKQGMQWPSLLQALALRPEGPPSFRLTGIGPPPPDGTDHLQEVGWKLAQLAETINVEFEYRGLVANSLADLNVSVFELRDGETVAVNSIFELHPLLAPPSTIGKVLQMIRELKPQIVTVAEQEASHNGDAFMDRFTESLHYFSTLFDSLESAAADTAVTAHDKAMSEVYLGRQICNVVACDGADRVERHETLTQWKSRFQSSGFRPVHLGSHAYKQASVLLALYAGGDGYRVEENDGCLMLGWHARPLIATSAWKLS